MRAARAEGAVGTGKGRHENLAIVDSLVRVARPALDEVDEVSGIGSRPAAERARLISNGDKERREYSRHIKRQEHLEAGVAVLGCNVGVVDTGGLPPVGAHVERKTVDTIGVGVGNVSRPISLRVRVRVADHVVSPDLVNLVRCRDVGGGRSDSGGSRGGVGLGGGRSLGGRSLGRGCSLGRGRDDVGGRTSSSGVLGSGCVEASSGGNECTASNERSGRSHGRGVAFGTTRRDELEDLQTPTATAVLGRITDTRRVAPTVVRHIRADCVATVAFLTVFNSSVFEASVFANGQARVNGHVGNVVHGLFAENTSLIRVDGTAQREPLGSILITSRRGGDGRGWGGVSGSGCAVQRDGFSGSGCAVQRDGSSGCNGVVHRQRAGCGGSGSGSVDRSGVDRVGAAARRIASCVVRVEGEEPACTTSGRAVTSTGHVASRFIGLGTARSGELVGTVALEMVNAEVRAAALTHLIAVLKTGISEPRLFTLDHAGLESHRGTVEAEVTKETLFVRLGNTAHVRPAGRNNRRALGRKQSRARLILLA